MQISSPDVTSAITSAAQSSRIYNYVWNYLALLSCGRVWQACSEVKGFEDTKDAISSGPKGKKNSQPSGLLGEC
jgi:hypothetical protein